MKSLLTDMAQFMDAMKPELVAGNAWSDWDQRIRDCITSQLTGLYHSEQAGALDADKLADWRHACWNGTVAFKPHVVKDLVAEIDRLAADNADMTQRLERAKTIAAEMAAIVRGEAT